MYDFVFENGTAKIIETATGNVAVVQPFKPINAGNEPWTSAEEAQAWMEENLPQYFVVYDPPNTEPLPVPEGLAAPDTPAEEPAAQGE